MDYIYIILKLIIFSIFGYYLFSILKKDSFNQFCKGIICPSYGIFSLISIFSPLNNILFLFLTGIIGECLIRFVMESMNIKTNDINVFFYGFLNIINYIILNPLIDLLFKYSTTTSIIFLFVFYFPIFLIDISLSLRKNL